jgi:hypothetical protein
LTVAGFTVSSLAELSSPNELLTGAPKLLSCFVVGPVPADIVGGGEKDLGVGGPVVGRCVVTRRAVDALNCPPGLFSFVEPSLEPVRAARRENGGDVD